MCPSRFTTVTSAVKTTDRTYIIFVLCLLVVYSIFMKNIKHTFGNVNYLCYVVMFAISYVLSTVCC